MWAAKWGEAVASPAYCISAIEIRFFAIKLAEPNQT